VRFFCREDASAVVVPNPAVANVMDVTVIGKRDGFEISRQERREMEFTAVANVFVATVLLSAIL
jgi:hypothetical protein